MHDPCSRSRRMNHAARRTLSGLALTAVGVIAAGTPAVAGAAELPDGRAYELVSDGAQRVGEVVRVPGIAEDGDAAMYATTNGIEGAGSVQTSSPAVARRTADGWQTTDASVPVAQSATVLGASGIDQLSPDLSAGIMNTAFSFDAGDRDGNRTDLYRFDAPSKAVDWLSHADTVPDTANGTSVLLLGASLDLQRAVFLMQGNPDFPGGPGAGIYARDADGLELLSRMPDPDGTPADGVAIVGTHGTRWANDINGRGYSRSAHGGTHIVSDDATRVFFSASGDGNNALFLRDGDRTVALSQSRRAGSVGQYSGSWTFIGATHDGAVSYFDSVDRLTDDAPEGGGIYRYTATTDELEIVVADADDPNGPVFNAGQLSDDGSHLYFVAWNALTPEATQWVPNLYVWTAEGGVKYIAEVGMFDTIARTSRDGRYALLASSVSIGGAPTNNRQSLYLYDDQSGDITCISCRPDGTDSQGDATLDQQPVGAYQGKSPRNITDDGRVFFATKDRLLPADKAAGTDIYEYDHGTLSLITTGTSDQDAYLADNTDDGRTLFFFSAERLTRADGDPGHLDLYAARVGGGFPDAAPSRPCTGEDCQPPVGGRPVLPSAGSMTAVGPGNVKPSPPPAGKVRRTIRLSSLSAAARRQLARTGSVMLSVRVTGGGTVTVRARGKIGRRTATLGTARRGVKSKSATTAHVRLRLSAAARRQLKRSGRLRTTIEARLSGVSSASRLTVTLTSAHR